MESDKDKYFWFFKQFVDAPVPEPYRAEIDDDGVSDTNLDTKIQFLEAIDVQQPISDENLKQMYMLSNKDAFSKKMI